MVFIRELRLKAWQMFLLQALILMAPHLDEDQAKPIVLCLVAVALGFMFIEGFK